MSEQTTNLPVGEAMSIEWLEETIKHIEEQQSQLQQSIADEQRAESEEEAKREIRKLSNRVSAARSRQRTRARLQELEEMVRQLAIRNITLKQRLATLLSERATTGAHVLISDADASSTTSSWEMRAVQTPMSAAGVGAAATSSSILPPPHFDDA